MKKLKRLIVFCLSVMMFSSVGISSAGAANIKPIEQGILYFEDGSYLTIDVIEFDSVLTRGTSVVSGKKIGTYSNNSGETLWTITVNGKFTYNGLSATAIDASYSYPVSYTHLDVYKRQDQKALRGAEPSSLPFSMFQMTTS